MNQYSAHLYRQIIENALDAFVVIDPASTVLVWSDQAEKVFGWSSTEAIGKAITGLIIPAELRQAHDAGMRNYLRTGERVVIGRRVEILAQHKDGRTFLVELSITQIEIEGAPVFSAALRDITERKAIEAQLRATFEQAAVGIAHLSPDGRILRINQKLCSILGHSCDDLTGILLQSLAHPDDPGLEEPALQLLSGEHATSPAYEKRYIRKSGEVVWLKTTLSVLREGNGNFDYFIALVEDITEAKNIKERAELLAAIIDASPDFVSLFKPDGELQYINRAGRELIGIPHEQDAREVPIAKKYPLWAYAVFKSGIQVAVAEGSWRGDTAVYSATGEEIPLSLIHI